MWIVNNQVYVSDGDLDRRAVQEAAERTGLDRENVRAAVVAYLNALERQEANRREFNLNGQDRW